MRTSRYVRFLTLALSLALASNTTSHAQPSTTSRVNVVVNGNINAVTRLGNTLYIGGGFNRIAPSSAALGSLFALSPTSGAPLPGRVPVAADTALAFLPDGAGGQYVAGFLDTPGGRRHTMRLNASGQIDTTYEDGLSAAARAMALAGGHLWVGGDFSFVHSQPRQRLVALDPATGQPRSFSVDANGSVFALAVNGPYLVVGGAFTEIGGQARSRMAVIDATTGEVSPWNPGADNTVTAIAIGATTGFVGGNFTTVGGLARSHIAAFDLDTGELTTWAPPAITGGINELVVSNGALYAGGSFSISGATPRANAAAFAVDTAAITAWNPLPGGGVTALAVSGSLVYIGGSFGQLGGQARTGLVAVDAASGALTPWNPNLFRAVNAVAIGADGAVIAGGQFNAVGGEARGNVAAVDMVSGNVLPWAPFVTGGPVLAMAAFDDVVVIGGSFSTINGQSKPRLAALEVGSGDVDEWTPIESAVQGQQVQALALANDRLYVGGQFDTILGQPRASVAAFDITNGELTSWAPSPARGNPSDPFGVFAIEAAGETIYIGGAFSTINGTARSGLAAVDNATGAVLPFDAGLPPLSQVFALASAGSSLFVGGDTAVGLRALDPASGMPTGGALPQPDNNVRALSVAGSTLFVGGSQGRLGTELRRGLGSIDLSQTPRALTTWNPDLGFGTLAVRAGADVIIAGGGFSRLAPVMASGVSVFEETSGPPPTPTGFHADAIDNLASLQWIGAQLGPRATGYTLEVGSTATSGNDLLSLALGNVETLNTPAPTGVYYVRVRATNAAGQSEPTETIRVEVGCTSPPGPVPWFGADVDGSNVALYWDRPAGNVARYLLEVGSASGLRNILTLPIDAPAARLDVAAVPPGPYYLRMKAANACGTSAASSETFIFVGAAPRTPGSPQDLRATVSGSNVSLSWVEPPGGPTGYVIEAGSASGLADIARIVLGPVTTFSTSGVPPGTYYVRVRSVNAAGIEPGTGGVVVVP